jgi:hypothetical protein
MLRIFSLDIVASLFELVRTAFFIEHQKSIYESLKCEAGLRWLQNLAKKGNTKIMRQNISNLTTGCLIETKHTAEIGVYKPVCVDADIWR